MTADRLPDDADGNIRFHYSIGTPPIVSNRSMFITYFITRDENGGTVVISGSLGNEQFETSHTELYGSNVVGNLIVSYQRITPFDGGYEIEQVSAFDVKGWIPSFIQGLSVSRQADVL